MTDRTTEALLELARHLYDSREVVLADRIRSFRALWTGERATRHTCPTCTSLYSTGPLSARCRASHVPGVSKWRRGWIPLGDDLPTFGADACPGWAAPDDLERT